MSPFHTGRRGRGIWAARPRAGAGPLQNSMLSDLVPLPAPARAAGLTVYDVEGHLKEIRTADDLPFAEADGRYYLACRRRFASLAEARAWLTRYGALLLALARDE